VDDINSMNVLYATGLKYVEEILYVLLLMAMQNH